MNKGKAIKHVKKWIFRQIYLDFHRINLCLCASMPLCLCAFMPLSLYAFMPRPSHIGTPRLFRGGGKYSGINRSLPTFGLTTHLAWKPSNKDFNTVESCRFDSQGRGNKQILQFFSLGNRELSRDRQGTAFKMSQALGHAAGRILDRDRRGSDAVFPAHTQTRV